MTSQDRVVTFQERNVHAGIGGTQRDRIVYLIARIPENGIHGNEAECRALVDLLDDEVGLASGFPDLYLHVKKREFGVRQHLDRIRRIEGLIQHVSPDGTGLEEHQRAFMCIANVTGFIDGLRSDLRQEVVQRQSAIRTRFPHLAAA
jgi:hypothetical protein